MNPAAFDTHYRRALVKAKVDCKPRFKAAVGEGAVQRLAVAHHHVSAIADKRYGAIYSLALRLTDEVANIDLTQLVAARKDPHTINRSAPIELSHKVKAVNIFIKVGAVPVCDAVLVPRDGGTNSRFLNEQGFIERCEVCAVNRLSNLQKMGMRIGAKAGIGEAQ